MTLKIDQWVDFIHPEFKTVIAHGIITGRHPYLRHLWAVRWLGESSSYYYDRDWLKPKSF